MGGFAPAPPGKNDVHAFQSAAVSSAEQGTDPPSDASAGISAPTMDQGPRFWQPRLLSPVIRSTWFRGRAGFVLLSAVELFLLQEATFALAYNPGTLFSLVARATRFFSDLFLLGAITLLLPRVGMIVMAVVALGINLGLVAYYSYFGIPLSLFTMMNQWREGRDVAKFSITAIPLLAAVLFGAALLAKIFLVRSARGTRIQLRRALAASAALFVAYVGLQAAFSCYDRPSLIREIVPPARFARGRGYTELWLAEWYYLDNSAVLKRATDTTRMASDRLTDLEVPLKIASRLIIIQVESLGFEAVDQTIDGKELMPFLDRLKDQSLFYRMRSPKRFGSADADFCILNAQWPSPDCINYKIPNFPYDGALPRFLKQFGFQTTCLMGDAGSTFSRRGPYEQMGFEEILFKEELLARYPVEIDDFGVRDPDLFRVSSILIRKPTDSRRPAKPICQFIVTTTSHWPWHNLHDSEKEIFPKSTAEVENYCNAFRSFDHTLCDYMMTLPPRTTVVIYGDHTSRIKFRNIVADWHGTTHFVPCWVYVVGENLAAQQRTRNSPVARDGSLTLLDLANYIRSQVRRSYAAP